MSINISVSGGWNFTDGIEEHVARAIEEGARVVCESAKEMCPVDTGALRASINVTETDNGALVSADTNYAAYVEFGTSKTAPQPYLVPALLQNRDAVMAAIADALTS